jgi:hypothetical protein
MSMMKLALLVDFQQEVCKLVLPNFLVCSHYFRKCFKLIWGKRGYANFDYRCNVSPIHLPAILGVGNFTKVVHVWADRL